MKMILIAAVLSFAFIGAGTGFNKLKSDTAERVACGDDKPKPDKPKADKPKADKPKRPKPNKPKNPNA